ncbi:uncharacterized protein LOC132736281 [Ruditapes philippinarum]|uniref:uncharacterized protein LOC132736281 n=1 Tax=Ruditapes philippinarum TaxID=129788 RepID=UPI00295B9248|nr:uncharacterized protein LOC132736281 [Ruditapes philippinarum]
MNSSKAFVLLLIVLNVVPGLCQQWTEVSIGLRRTIGSAIEASAFLGGTYTGMLKAFAQVQPPDVSFARYYVYFFVSFPDGEIRMCKGIVLWRFEPTFVRTTERARCGL